MVCVLEPALPPAAWLLVALLPAGCALAPLVRLPVPVPTIGGGELAFLSSCASMHALATASTTHRPW